MKITDYANQEFTLLTPSKKTKVFEVLTASLAFIIPAIFLLVISAY